MRRILFSLGLLLPFSLLAQPCSDNVVVFSASTNGPLAVFFATTNPAADGVLWEFGDGAFGEGLQATHAYDQAGIYTVCANAWWNIPGTQDSCWVQDCQDIQVTIGGGCDPDFSSTFSAQIEGGTVLVVGTASRPFDGMIFWLDGVVEADGPTAEFVISTPGEYEICLDTWYWNSATQDTCWAGDCQTITIGPDVCIGFEAGFTWAETPNGVQFSNATVGTGDFTNWFWSFGDNTGSNQPQPFHTYSTPGIYNVCLTAITVFEVDGEFLSCEDTECIMIEVGDPCSILEACIQLDDLGDDTYFFGNCSPMVQGALFFWDFGDGNSSASTVATHAYSAPGTYTACLTMTWQNCSDSTCVTIIVEDNDPCSMFGVDFVYNTTPNGTFFTSIVTSGMGAETTYFWDFGDGGTGSGLQAFHVYDAPGVYIACLEVVSTFEVQGLPPVTCTGFVCDTITISGMSCDGFEACFVPSQLSENAVFFNNCSSNDTGTTYLWDFGDGMTDNATAPVHTYDSPGTYTVCLTAVWMNCVDTTCVVVQVGSNAPCDDHVAAFNHFISNDGVVFTNQSQGTGSQTTYFWDLGDGSTSTMELLNHQYAQPGVYLVCLEVISVLQTPNGFVTCVDSTCALVTVGGPGPCEAGSADFNQTTTPNGTLFNLINGPYFAGYLWNFGDGTQSSEEAPFHTYIAPGTYEACLTLTFPVPGPGGVQFCTDSSCVLITVEGAGPCDELTAGFMGSAAGLGVNFANDVIDLSWTYAWDFGDGTSGDGPNPYHTYNEAGTYEVCLLASAWDPVAQDSCFATECRMITTFSEDPCDGLEACFVPSPTGPTTFFFNNCSDLPMGGSYFWDFGDGTTSGSIAPFHTYTGPGTYTVCLIAQVPNCADSTCTTVIVGGGDPCADVQAGFIFTTTPNGTQFSNTSAGLGEQTVFTWSFGDGATSSDAQPSHVYDAPGVYEACLEVITIFSTNNGAITCIDSTCMNVVIGGGDGCAGFGVGFQWTGQNNVVIFSASSNRPDVTYTWELGDGTTGSGTPFTHLYEPPGPFQVCLNGSYWSEVDQDSCYAQSCEIVDPFLTVGLQQAQAGTGITIYPQPTHGELFLRGEALKAGTTVRLFAQDGQLVRQERATGTLHRMDVSDLAAAVYLLDLEDQGQHYRSRVVVQ